MQPATIALRRRGFATTVPVREARENFIDSKEIAKPDEL
jgi:hypothetical protein